MHDAISTVLAPHAEYSAEHRLDTPRLVYPTAYTAAFAAASVLASQDLALLADVHLGPGLSEGLQLADHRTQRLRCFDPATPGSAHWVLGRSAGYPVLVVIDATTRRRPVTVWDVVLRACRHHQAAVLAQVPWPTGTPDTLLDQLARSTPLWAAVLPCPDGRGLVIGDQDLLVQMAAPPRTLALGGVVV